MTDAQQGAHYSSNKGPLAHPLSSNSPSALCSEAPRHWNRRKDERKRGTQEEGRDPSSPQLALEREGERGSGVGGERECVCECVPVIAPVGT